jgi:hypothetical protein
MATFTERLYLETKNDHIILDHHPFIFMIRKNKLAAEMYINFNKICIYELQQVLKIKDVSLQSRLHRDIEQPDMYIYEHLNELLILCKQYPLELEYMFKVGLIKGGNMLKKYIPKHAHDFLTFNNPNDLFNDFKNYLNDNVTNQTLFIKNVNDAYKLIKLCFDCFFSKINPKLDIQYRALDVQESRQLDSGSGSYSDSDT